MFEDKDLQNFLETSSVIRNKSIITAEWNMNIPTNIKHIGNYRYRPTQQGSIYSSLPTSFDINDAGNFYTGATDADVVIDGTFDNNDIPTTLLTKKEKLKTLYSLEECFGQFRPRSGINKAAFFENGKLHHPNLFMADRPRYYMPDKNDKFKYWTSYRTESGEEYGIASKVRGSQNSIEDACPFVVYKEKIPANRVVVKMQTHTGTENLGPFSSSTGSFADPFFGELNQKTPSKWKIQFLKDGNWESVISFDPNIVRRDGSSVIKSDGYVEIAYGLIVPENWRPNFVLAETYTSASLLPEQSVFGYAYLIKANENDIGAYHIWDGTDYVVITPKYGWYIQDETVDRLTNFVTDATSPNVFIRAIDKKQQYREFDYISGIRIVVDTMNVKDSTFDLIEISPRLVLDVSDKTLDYSINKSASDLGLSGLPVGQLIASNGQITLFDYDQAFNDNNQNSIISKYIARHVQFKFYEVIVDVNGWDYYVPIKTLYSDSFPKQELMTKQVSISLRDLYWYLEALTAPEILMTEVSVSSAVSLLLDHIGFSNYTFKRVKDEKEIIIPYFFVAPEKSVAQILQDLAVSTQTAMFFDEYNNFVMMSKDYIMPTLEQRPTTFALQGTKDFVQDREIKNKTTKPKLANIISVSTQSNSVYNDGVINYKVRHIQRSIGSLRQASLVDSERYYTYKPALLWEVSGSQNTKSINNEVGTQSSYVLSAIPLNSNLSADVPVVKNNILINNTLSLGEAVYWITRYNGYFYSQGEIIKYDAVQYNVSGYGNVWITSTEDYQNYFAKLPFNGKIYPTGLVRIYSEPRYFEKEGVVKLQNGAVEKHGRGQFGTEIVAHSAGIADYWKSDNNVKGCYMLSEYLFEKDLELPDITVEILPGATPSEIALLKAAGKITLSGTSSDALARTSSRSGIIKNFMSTSFIGEVSTSTPIQSGTLQSSALSLTGPNFTTKEKPRDFISYVHKSLESNKFKHFGTRMRLVGKIESNADRGQTSNGSSTYYVVNGSTPDKNINISGGSGGLAVMLNPTTNVGYYFEIAALGVGNLSEEERQSISNVFFYKIKSDNGIAIPVPLWSGLGQITVDDGKFTGQSRMVAEENPTVYDLAVEYEDIGRTRKFYLYLNGKLIKTVDDTDPLPVYSDIALFSRGSSRAMFENVYALCNNYSQNTTFSLGAPVNSVFGDSDIDANESFRKYALSGLIQNTYLSGIGTSEPPKYNIYFEEFGSIMREAATFNFKYDKAFPALTAKISPTFNKIKGYVVSGFRAGSYGAEFIIFNSTDTAISLDETTGNYLRIQGITFTQESDNKITVDDYFNRNSSLSNPEFITDTLISNPFKFKQDYQDIKLSRMTHGKQDFSLDTPYIQSYDEANGLMKWLVEKITKPRRSVGVKIFAIPTLQLGDIVTLDYQENGINMAASPKSRFVVYNIEYAKSSDGPDMTVFLSEVV
jgi:signal peptidase I